MTSAEPTVRRLEAEFARLSRLLAAHRDRLHGTRSPEPAGRAGDAGAGSGPVERLPQLFGLSRFEMDLLLLCAGVELDRSVADLIRSLQDGGDSRPTFNLALAALPDAHWSALSPGRALRRWRLIDGDFSGALTVAPLRIDERVLHYLLGAGTLDGRLAGIVEPVDAVAAVPASQRHIAERISAVWSGGAPQRAPVAQLCGDAITEKLGVAAAACAALGAQLALAYGDAIPTEPAAMASFARLWEREARLSSRVLLIDLTEIDSGDRSRVGAVLRFLEMVGAPVMLATHERLRLLRRASVSYEVSRPTSAEQGAAWRDALGNRAEGLNGAIDRLVAQFQLGRPAIAAASLEAVRTAADESALPSAVWAACRMQARPRLDDLAQRIEPHAGWDGLVLPDVQRGMLRDIASQVRHRATVYDRWGFAGRGARGLGISALFAGASGTGKTTAAEILANELELDLYRIDLSAVVSKYIGETEKNLRRVFDAAEEGGAILLFDEADALFGKRSDVKDSHDRYANIEVSYLLQRMESYRGLAILTSNLKNALDTAFLRRIRFVVQFPFPDPAQRAEIWRRVFPRETPVGALRPERLAQLDVAGGNIRNIALNAAFLAAADGGQVDMGHVLEAARGEYAKIEKPLTTAETTGWLEPAD